MSSSAPSHARAGVGRPHFKGGHGGLGLHLDALGLAAAAHFIHAGAGVFGANVLDALGAAVQHGFIANGRGAGGRSRLGRHGGGKPQADGGQNGAEI